MILSRRNLAQVICAGFAPWFPVRGFAADFWNAKDPDSWTPDEIVKLRRKSPWAKEVSGERIAAAKAPPVNDPTLRNPLPRRNPTRLPPAGRPKPDKTVTTYKGYVVWESAKVVRDAAREPLPDGFDNQYVLSVAGLPLTRSSGKNALNNVRALSMLTVKGRDPLEAATVQQQTGNGAVYYFGFSRAALTITRDDKEVAFTTHMGRILFTAKFSPRDMIYRGELAL
jgi:hypothetical protein